MPLSDWSSPIETNELECKKLKRTLRKKVTDHRQFDSLLTKDDDEELADFVPNAVLTRMPADKPDLATPPKQPDPPKPPMAEPATADQYGIHPEFMQYVQQPPRLGNETALSDKLNYVVRLLEDQRDEKTAHVTEELILYAFLGVFVIFVLDSFVRTGKYVR